MGTVEWRDIHPLAVTRQCELLGGFLASGSLMWPAGRGNNASGTVAQDVAPSGSSESSPHPFT